MVPGVQALFPAEWDAYFNTAVQELVAEKASGEGKLPDSECKTPSPRTMPFDGQVRNSDVDVAPERIRELTLPARQIVDDELRQGTFESLAILRKEMAS